MSHALVFRSIAQSNMRHGEKSAIARLFDGMRGTKITKHHVVGGLHALRSSTEAIAVGAALGALAAEVGLDVKGKVPVDFGLGIASMGTAVLLEDGGHGLAIEARNVGTTAFGIFGFREMYGLVAEMKKKKGGTAVPLKALMAKTTISGEENESDDPVMALAHTFEE